MNHGAETQRPVALAGNPNVGKSSIFNALTGMHQHTGNWPGKTVAVAQGDYFDAGEQYAVTDLPGTYSLRSGSEEEHIAAEYLQTHTDACIVAVCDATCLARSLSLAIQLMQRCDCVIVCVNLMDEAAARGIQIELHSLQALLGVPVIGTCANSKEDIRRLKLAIRNAADGYLTFHPHLPAQTTPAACFRYAQQLAAQVVSGAEARKQSKLERILTGRWSGSAIFAVLLVFLFWLTLEGSNILSNWLQICFDWLQEGLLRMCDAWPQTLRDALISGIYETAARVTAVMLPPAAIFFVLFSILEDAGYLPRAAFLTDCVFERCGTSGRQALTMCMGIGCNAVGVTGCRIMGARKEKLIAVCTNAMVPCNGRFPMLLTMAGVLTGTRNGLLLALVLAAAVCIGMGGTAAVSAFLGRRFKEKRSDLFTLELPPYRRPQLRKILNDAIFGKTLHVLARAALVAAPAGLLLWLIGHVQTAEGTLLQRLTLALDKPGRLLGMNGAILVGFLFALPANELAVPVILMILTGQTSLGTAQTMAAADALAACGISAKTAVCCLIFCVFHWPCSTTLLSVKRETGSLWWTVLSALIPTGIGILLCSLVNLIF